MADWIEQITSAWTGHRQFAEWLVDYLKPAVIVDLGVDFGYSTFTFSEAAKHYSPHTRVYGVDWFKGDVHTSERNTRDHVYGLKSQHNVNNLEIVEGDIDEVGANWANGKAKIIHIDALHTYDAVKKNYESWLPHLEEDGIMLFHDVCVPHFTVRQFFDEIALPKMYFTHSAGLGIVSRDRELLDKIKELFPHVI